MLSRNTGLRFTVFCMRARESAALLEISQQARDLLYSRPTPMRRAASLVSQYEGLLNGLKGTS